MITNYIPLDTDSINETDSDNSSKTKNLIRLASMLSIFATGLTVALIILVSAKANPVNKVCMLDECVTTAGYLSSSMDLSVDPCDSFYKFTCGKWQDDHPFPANVDGWSHFYKLTYEMRKNIRKDLENMTIDTRKLISYEKLYNFYHGCVNITSRNSSGYSELKSKIKDIGGWPTIDVKWTETNFDWEQSLIQSIKLKHFPLMRIQAMRDLMDKNKTIITIGPSTNPEEDIIEWTKIFEDKTSRTKFEYFDMTNKSEENRLLLHSLINEITKENNSKINKTSISTTIDNDFSDLKVLYTNLTKIVSPSKSAQYYMINYDRSKHTVLQLSQRYPQINFLKILKGVFNNFEITNETVVFVQDADYLDNLNKIMNSKNNRVIANYIATSFVIRFGRYTTTKMINLLVDILDEPEVLPNICYDLTEKYLPNLLGRFYVDKHFNETWKNEMIQIIDLVHNSLNESLGEHTWMDDDTKQEAIKKVLYIEKNIAYPNWTRNDTELDDHYRDVVIDPDDFFSSMLNVIEANVKENLNMLQTNTNTESDSESNVIDSWPSHDATYVNAFYYFSTNGIYFPAGIAQYPFFMYGRPMAMNLGSIGMIIGHEMTHSLDNQGRLYDYRGDLRNWWQNHTRDSFLNKSQCFVDQYNGFHFPEYKMNVSGVRTLAENIADNGGIRQAYSALEKYKLSRNRPFIPLPGKMQKFTEDQLFFISFANMWCSNMMPTAVQKTLKSGVHAPESVRVDGVLSNFDKFTEAFNCSAKARMNPERKCILW